MSLDQGGTIRETHIQRTLHPHFTAQVDSITIPVGPRLGGKVLDATRVSKGFGDRLLVDGLEFSVPPGDCPGLQECGAYGGLCGVAYAVCPATDLANGLQSAQTAHIQVLSWASSAETALASPRFSA